MTPSLQGKVVLITGASAGIGRATAMTLANMGAHIIALGRREDALQQLQAALPSGAVRMLVGDLNDDAYLKQVEAVASEVDIFVNNAGVLRYAPLLELSSEDCEWMFQTNVLASLKVTQILGRAMVARKAGHMVFMTSVAAREV